MTNPTTLIPAKVRLVIYLAVFLFSVALTDFYIYLLATGAFDDPRFF